MKSINYMVIIPEFGLWNKYNNARVRHESRSLGYFLALKLKEAKFKSDKFSGIFFQGSKTPNPDIYYMNNLLIIDIKFPEESYPSKDNSAEINEYLIKRIEDGLVKIQEKYSEIASVVRDGIDDFRIENYKCIWIHKKRKIGNATVRLRCEMNTEYFRLYFEVLNKNGKYNQSRLLLETLPSEYHFKKRFKDLILSDNEFFITDFLDRKVFIIRIKSLDQYSKDNYIFDGEIECVNEY